MEELEAYRRRTNRPPKLPAEQATVQPLSETAKHHFRLERDFQTWIIGEATRTGWKHYHTRRSDKSPKGWPDLVLGHEQRNITLFRELKLDGKSPTSEQQWWLDMLQQSGHNAAVWRPADIAEIKRELRNT